MQGYVTAMNAEVGRARRALLRWMIVFFIFNCGISYWNHYESRAASAALAEIGFANLGVSVKIMGNKDRCL